MSSTATEQKNHQGKNLVPAGREGAILNRTLAAKRPSPSQDRADMAKSLFGILPPGMTVEKAREERLDQV